MDENHPFYKLCITYLEARDKGRNAEERVGAVKNLMESWKGGAGVLLVHGEPVWITIKTAAGETVHQFKRMSGG